MRIQALVAAMLVGFGANAWAQVRTTVSFFIASDCPISNAYAPEMVRICRAYEAKGVSCRLVYEDAKIDAASMHKHIVEYRLGGMLTTADNDRQLADAVHVTITPTAVVTDAAGHVRYRGRIDNLYINIGRTRQQVTRHDLTDALTAVLAEQPVKEPVTESLGCYIER